MGLTVLPTIAFNSGTGSDVAASGAGPSTAVAAGGNDGASTNNTTTVDLSADSPDLSGVAQDGSAVLWVDSGSGRQFSRIDTVNDGADTVVCEDTFTQTEANRNWGIGGERATLDNANSRKLFSADIKPGWVAELEDTQAITGSVLILGIAGSTAVGSITIQGSSEGRIITQSANARIFEILDNLYGWIFKNLHFKNSNGSKASAQAIYGGHTAGGIDMTSWIAEKCIFGDATHRLQSVWARRGGDIPTIVLIDCEIKETNSHGLNNEFSNVSLYGCSIHDAQGASFGIRYPSATFVNTGLVLINCLIYNNGGDGIATTSATYDNIFIITGCTIHGNGGDGIDVSAGVPNTEKFACYNNNITGNGGYGINAASGANNNKQFINFNNFGTGGTANTSGTMNNIDAGDNDLGVDPQYTNANTGDFSVGTNVKALGFPDASRSVGANQSNTTTYVDVGAAQREEPAGNGGGLLVHPGMVGGMRG